MHHVELLGDLCDMLVPAGCGVYTVNTAKEHKTALQQKLYGSHLNIKDSWLESLKKINTTDVLLLGVCSDAGGGIQRGANWGALYLRSYLDNYYERLLDLGDIKVIPHFLHDKYLTQDIITACQAAIYNNKNLPVSPLSITESVCQIIYTKFKSKKILAFGGDHSVSYPLVKSYLTNASTKKPAVIHFDAHTDLLDTRLGVDLCFATWAKRIIDYLPDPSHLVQIGLRSSAYTKQYWVEKLGITQYWATEIRQKSAALIAEDIINMLLKKGVNELYISFDVDALDQEFAGATGTPETDGLTPLMCVEIIDMLAQNFPVAAADIVEVAPFVNFGINSNTKETTLNNAAFIANKLISCLQ